MLDQYAKMDPADEGTYSSSRLDDTIGSEHWLVVDRLRKGAIGVPQPKLWVEEIREALAELGGQANLTQIYRATEQRNQMDFDANPHWKAAVRRTIQQHSSDTDIFTGLAQDDVFFAPQGKGVGYWALRSHIPEPEPLPIPSTPPANPSTSTTQRVFVSHSHKDNEFTARLVDDLQAAGADVWVDLKKVAYDNFVTKINEGLINRQWLVLVQTPDALRSAWVQLEVNAALALVVRKRMRAVIPFIARSCEPDEIPPLWAALYAYDATRDYQGALTGLLERRSKSQAASPKTGRRARTCKLLMVAQRRRSKRFLRSPR